MIKDVWCLTGIQENRIYSIHTDESQAIRKFFNTLNCDSSNTKIVKRRAIKDNDNDKYYLIDDSDEFWYNGFKLKNEKNT